jgi:hypothetical protein
MLRKCREASLHGARKGREMKLSRWTTVCGTALLMIWVCISVSVSGQARGAAQAPAPGPQLSEQAFKNVTELKGIPVREFMNTMGFFAASLALNCYRLPRRSQRERLGQLRGRHPDKEPSAPDDQDGQGDQRGEFRRTSRSSPCYTCHRGSQKPKVIPEPRPAVRRAATR